MQQFQVPQYIEIEDKIVGSLTVKDLVYVLGGCGFFAILWVLNLPGIIFWPLAFLVGGFVAALALLKINGQPFTTVLNNAFNHYTQTRLYIWKRTERKAEKMPTIALTQTPTTQYIPKLSERKLKDLSWSLDINQQFKR